MARRIYLDTSVIGGCFDEEFADWSNRLFDEIRHGWWMAVVSDLTEAELRPAPMEVKRVLANLPPRAVERVTFGPEAERLAKRYVLESVVIEKHFADAQHIAVGTVARVDVLVSWNFRHVVNLDRIRAFNAVNLKTGYPMLEIRSPREVFHEKGV